MLAVLCMVLASGLMGIVINYTAIINEKNKEISSLNRQLEEKNNIISTLNLAITDLQIQINSKNSQIANLQSQITGPLRGA